MRAADAKNSPTVRDYGLPRAPRLLQWGVPVTLNTDDPGMFGTDLTREYRIAHEVFGLTIPELVHIARTAIIGAYCSDELRAQLLAKMDDVAGNA
jgi:aminodeoxyfutalosine deaminase